MKLLDFESTLYENVREAFSREWLETNGLGGFASSSITGANTRRYHALLTAATTPPTGRMVLLSKLEETLTVAGERFELATNEYPGVVHPQGYRHLVGFRLDPFPIFTFECGGIRLEKSVFMPQGENTTVVTYDLLLAPAGKDVCLELRPLIAFRDYHSTTHENSAISHSFEQTPNLAVLQPYEGVPRLYLAHDAEHVEGAGIWYKNFVYAIERERGLDFQEDLFNPLVFRFDLTSRASATVIASLKPHDVSRAADLRRNETDRRRAIADAAPTEDAFTRMLALAADQYIVARGDRNTVVAGYPWFTDWGRDTMIALPGLTLFTGRHDVARQVLAEFAQHVDMGMLPNRFPDAGEQPEYNTVDATLWFFEAIRAYAAATGDYEFVHTELWPVLNDIIEWHVRGTRYGIAMKDTGLLKAGEQGVQLTWMDAKIGDWVVTPRTGCPVEIQALWFNALKIMEDFAARFADDALRKRFSGMAATAQWSFNRLFWNEKSGCLYDVINGGPPDASIRPNQIFAVSLRYTMLSAERARLVVEAVERELLTPVGLRSLAPSDPNYRGRYEGDGRARDSVYHQGTVWPWLLGPFVSAYVKVNGSSEAARRHAAQMLDPLREHLCHAGLLQISEIFDGDAPHSPRGCFAQAWSVAEIMRVLCEDVYQLKVQPRRTPIAASSVA
jgi:predicted glycogen debranching enzyme